jgi:hypothetical protein
VRRHAKASFAGSTQGSGTRRGLLGLVCLCVLGLATFLGISAPSASAQACSNEALREQEGATFLPDCRAYEQSSPIFKNGNHIQINSVSGHTVTGPVISDPSGDAVTYGSRGSFAGTEAGMPTNQYASTRGSDGWQAFGLQPANWNGTYPFVYGFIPGTTPDFSQQLVVTASAVTPGATEGKWNAYIRHAYTGSYELIATAPGYAFNSAKVNFAVPSTDGSRWLFGVNKAHLESTPAPVNGEGSSDGNLYEYSTTGELKLAGVLPGGGASPGGSWAADASSKEAFPARRSVSEDGSQVYWTSSGPPAPIYLYRNGESTLVTERASDSSTQSGRFWFASPDGSQAFITSDNQLTADASPAGYDLYRYDRESEGLTDLTPEAAEAGVEGVLGISDDGSYVYFMATGDLAPGATAGQHNIYAWHNGDIRLIATSAGGFSTNILTAMSQFRVSPNGGYLGFVIGGELTGPNPQPNPGAEEAYLYNYGNDTLNCASCPPGAPSGDADFQRTGSHDPDLLLKNFEGLTRNVIDDGRMFFETPDALVPKDTNGQIDVYEYSNGQVHLISTGQSPEFSYFGDASPTGQDVFFVTIDRLVGQDQDGLFDLYDARTNGGIAAQNPTSEPGCEGETCQGNPTAAPSQAGAATAGFAGRGNISSKQNCNKLGKEAKKLSKRSKRLRKNANKAKKAGNSRRAKQLNKKANRLAKQARNKSKSAKKCRKRNRGASK